MAHVSLYRRFRPQSFDEMVRQEHVVRILKNQIGSGSIGHAYLFTGPRGTGKTTVARIFARAINCEHPVDGSPCGECPTCLALQNGSLDVSEIDAASNNGVNEMRELREKVQYPPVNGRYKVFIIDEVHMLTDSAFNALLKTLEEPPAHAVFILATTEPQRLPATILSRCMRLDFKLIPEEDLEEHLMRVLDGIGKKYEREAVSAIARAGAGSDRDMLSIAEMCIAYSDELTYDGVTAVLGAADFHVTCGLVHALLSAESGEAIERTERILSEGKSVGVLVRNVLDLLNQVLVAKTCRTAEKLLSLPKELFEEVKGLADGTDGRAILRATEVLSETESELRYTASPRIAVETAIVRIATPAEDYDLDALLVRVKTLETALEKLQKDGVAVNLPPKQALEPSSDGKMPVPQETFAEKLPDLQEDFEEILPPPMEEPVFDEAYFADGETGEAPEIQSGRREKAEELPSPSPAPKAVSDVGSAGTGPNGDATVTFGTFMRTLRRMCRNGVLVTICSDLEAAYEGDVFLLCTDNETVFRSLKREDHAAILKDVFGRIGVERYEVRKKGQAEKSDGVEQLKKDFREYPIDLK